MITAHAAIDGGQGWKQIGELLVAFALSCTVGLERQYRGKSAGLRTQTIVGTTAALIVLVSKYGFSDVLASGTVVLDPSRVAAQIVSGIGFLGAGLIITRQGAIRGLTTAAAVWETAAIGMAAGAGLPVLAIFVTGLHFVSVLALAPLSRRITERGHSERRYVITYEDGRGVLRDLMTLCSQRAWSVTGMDVGGHSTGSREGLADDERAPDLVTTTLTIAGAGAGDAVPALTSVAGVVRIERDEAEDD